MAVRTGCPRVPPCTSEVLSRESPLADALAGEMDLSRSGDPGREIELGRRTRMMRYLLDTNVLSEPALPSPHPCVLGWLREQSGLNLAISVFSLGEIGKGVALLAPGEERERLEGWLACDLPRQFRDRVLPVGERVALAWGRLAAEGRAQAASFP
jgi:predicted nucleic acid-binding protein